MAQRQLHCFPPGKKWPFFGGRGFTRIDREFTLISQEFTLTFFPTFFTIHVNFETFPATAGFKTKVSTQKGWLGIYSLVGNTPHLSYMHHPRYRPDPCWKRPPAKVWRYRPWGHSLLMGLWDGNLANVVLDWKFFPKPNQSWRALGNACFLLGSLKNGIIRTAKPAKRGTYTLSWSSFHLNSMVAPPD